MITRGQVTSMSAVLSDKGYKKNLINGNKLCDETNPFEEEVASRTDIKELNFNLVPNPANTKVEIIFENSYTNLELQIQLFDAAGKRIIDMLIPSIGEMRGKTSIDISKLESNTYIVKLKSGDKVVTKKLIKI